MGRQWDLRQGNIRRYWPLTLLLVGLLLLTACGVGGPVVTPTLPFRTATPPPSPTPRSSPTPRLVLTLEPTNTAAPITTPRPTVAATPVLAQTPAGTAATGRPAAIAFSAENAYRHVEELSISIGSRPAGSEAEIKAADYVTEQLGALGYTVTRQLYSYTAFQDNGSQVSIENEARSITTLGLYYSRSGNVSAQLVAAGNGTATDFQSGLARGKIALIERGGPTFLEKVRNAQAGGAVAVIIYNNVPNVPPSQAQREDYPILGNLREPVELPVVMITLNDGNFLKNRIEQRGGNLRVTVRTNVQTEMKQSHNIQAISAGAAMGGQRPIIIVGSHHDTVPAGPGANDNASGVGVMLELARVLAKEQRAELRFVSFSAQEVGQFGSRAYVEGLTADERGRIVAMINLDAVSVGPTLAIGGSSALVTRTLTLAEQMSLTRVIRLTNQRSGQTGDHLSFIAANVPTVFLHRPDDANWHGAQDRPQFVLPKALLDVGNLSLRLIEQLIDRPNG